MIVMVVGMHRSGTSALAGVLHKNGVHMGTDAEFIPGPLPENPKGFFENVRFRELNDALLGAEGYSAKSFSSRIPPFPVEAPGVLLDDMITLVGEQRVNYPVWGFKDPRTCLTGLSWLDVLIFLGLGRILKVLHIVRNPKAVADSMVRRGDGENADRAGFERLAIEYQHRARLLRPDLEIRFDDLMAKKPMVAADLSEVLGMSITDWSHIDRRPAE